MEKETKVINTPAEFLRELNQLMADYGVTADTNLIRFRCDGDTVPFALFTEFDHVQGKQTLQLEK